MAYQSCHRFARIAPRKARLVADMIRGKPVDQALTALDFSTKRGACFIRYVLRSAIRVVSLLVRAAWTKVQLSSAFKKKIAAVLIQFINAPATFMCQWTPADR